MRSTSMERSEGGQMLLATGVVLLMSLLSMAIFGVPKTFSSPRAKDN